MCAPREVSSVADVQSINHIPIYMPILIPNANPTSSSFFSGKHLVRPREDPDQGDQAGQRPGEAEARQPPAPGRRTRLPRLHGS